MSTEIVPATGAGVVATQQGIGTTPGYSAIDFRRATTEGAQEGVVAANDTEAGGWMVTQRAAGANMSVDIAANVALAKVQGDSVTQQGLYTVAPHATVINEAIATADATNPRIDQVILEVLDNVHDASGANLARTRVLTGTPTAGATADNRLGAAALPSNCFRLADIPVAAAAASVPNSSIRDRRAFARGFHYQLVDQSANYTNATTTLSTLISQKRLELSGVPVEVTVTLSGESNTVDLRGRVDPRINGSVINEHYARALFPVSGVGQMFSWTWLAPSPAAGSATFDVQAALETGAGTLTVYGGGSTPRMVSVREIVAQNTYSNSVTSG